MVHDHLGRGHGSAADAVAHGRMLLGKVRDGYLDEE